MDQLIAEAVDICEEYRRQGYACSESVCRALNDIYHMELSEDTYKVMSVFAGGAIDDGRCGVLEAGMLALTILKERDEFDTEASLEQLSINLHQTFIEYYGGYQCRDIFYPLYKKHIESKKQESDFFCAFHEGIALVTKVIENNRRKKK